MPTRWGRSSALSFPIGRRGRSHSVVTRSRTTRRVRFVRFEPSEPVIRPVGAFAVRWHRKHLWRAAGQSQRSTEGITDPSAVNATLFYNDLDCDWRSVAVQALYYQRTYLSLLEGRANREMNDRIIQEVRSEMTPLWGRATSLCYSSRNRQIRPRAPVAAAHTIHGLALLPPANRGTKCWIGVSGSLVSGRVFR